MDVKMICVNVCSDKYAYIIIAERAWESGEEVLGLLLYFLDYLH